MKLFCMSPRQGKFFIIYILYIYKNDMDLYELLASSNQTRMILINNYQRFTFQELKTSLPLLEHVDHGYTEVALGWQYGLP